MRKEGYSPEFILAYSVAVVLTPILHFYLLSQLAAHPTIHVSIGIVLFTILFGASRILVFAIQGKRR